MTTACAYVEQHVDDWIRARIRGEEWAPAPLPEHPVLIRKKEMLRRVGLTDPAVWHLEQRGKFPKRIRLTDAPGEASGPPTRSTIAKTTPPAKVRFVRGN